VLTKSTTCKTRSAVGVGRVIILTPAAVRFVALSATIGNANFIGEWFAEVRGLRRSSWRTNGPSNCTITWRSCVAVSVVEIVDCSTESGSRTRRVASTTHEGNQEVPTGTEVEGT